MAARVLARLAAVTGEERYTNKAKAVLAALGGTLKQSPFNCESLALASALLAEGSQAHPPTTAGASATAQAGHVNITATVTPTAVAIGGTASVIVVLEIDPGYHVNAPKAMLDPSQADLVPTQVVVSGARLEPSPVSYPPATKLKLGGESVAAYTGKVTISVPVKVAAGARGEHALKVSVTTQACDDKACQLPQTQELRLSVHVK
jgi:DsbC/DsbD-like thiol-disulfide interchange protein